MDFSANRCPLSIDNTLAPGTELLCWDTGAFNQLVIDIQGIDAAEYELVGDPGQEVLSDPTITADGKYVYQVSEYSRVCLKMVTAGIGTATVEAYLTETISLISFGCVPFALFDGTENNIHLVLGLLPFNLFDGTSNNIPVVPC